MLKKMIPMALVLSCSLFAPTLSYANPPIPKPLGSVINAATPAGGAIPKGAFGVVINYINADKDRVWVSGSDYDAKNHAKFNLLAIKPRYGLGNGWDVRALIPFITSDFSEIHSKNGVGDSVLILRKQIFSQANNSPVSFAMGLGVLIPTGSTSYDGLGNGAWGIHSELGMTYAFDGGRQLVEGGLIYQYRGTGQDESQTGVIRDDLEYGGLIKAHARYVIALNKNWDLGVEAQFEHGLEGSRHSEGLENGYTSLYGGPSIRFKYPEWKASFGISPQFALYNDYEQANRNGGGPAAEQFRIEAQFQKAF